MVKQIKEQVDILCRHVEGGAIDLEFISLHAMHLSQLATFLRTDNRASEISRRQDEFLDVLCG